MLLEDLERRTFFSVAAGMTIPTGHARLWFTPERLATAKQWYASHPFTPSTDDAMGNAFLYQLTGNTTAAQKAITSLMNFTISSSELNGVASDNYRWNDWVPVVFDWCYDQMTPTQRNTFMTRYDGYVSIMQNKGWGGVGMTSNNYYWGYLRNEFNWAIATYYEDPNAAGFLNHAMVTRYQNDFLPWANDEGAGGVPQEGTQYGRYMLQYPTVPWGSAETMGRDVLGESDWYRGAVYYMLYSTLPGQTSDGRGGWQLFPFDDDEASGGFPDASDSNYGDFMTLAAGQWASEPIGQWARQWLNTVRPSVDNYVAAVDTGGPTRALSSLPLDYYASGPGYLWAKDSWSSSAMSTMFQLGGPSGVGHNHLDQGTFQIWRNGRWLSKESTGYGGATIRGLGGSGTEDVNSTFAHNGILINGNGQAALYSNGNGNVTRLESQTNYTFASVDVTASYRSSDSRFDNTQVGSIVRDFLYVRSLGVLIALDRLRSISTTAAKTFLLHFTNNPVLSGNTVTETNGNQVLKLTALTPSGQSAPTMQVVNETTSTPDNSVDYQYRLEETTSGAAQQYLLNVIQARDATGADVSISMTENASSFTLTLTGAAGTAVVVLNKGMTSTGGSISFTPSGAATQPATPLTTSVEDMAITGSGPVWGGSGTPTLAFGTATSTVDETAGTATITVTRSGSASTAVSVNYATSNGTAQAGSDYTTTSGTLNFAAGERTKAFTVPITNDTLAEANETVNISLSSPGGGATLGSPATQVLTIVDNDQPGQLQFGASNYTVSEGGGTATITVTRTGGSTGAVSVNYATSNGSATSGSDYTATSGTLSFADGQTSKSFTVPILQDTSAEGDETINLTLSGVVGATLGTRNAAVLTIVDDDYGAGPFSLWPSSTVPGVVNDSDPASTEVGVKFRTDMPGYITGLRFYKGPLNTGTHIGHLWDRSGNLLATATFTGETASGWQQVTFSQPVAISANTTYVASYLAPGGRYAEDDGYFDSTGVDRGPLHALASGVDGVNGVYAYSSGSTFPTSTYLNANYWVDVVFTPTTDSTAPVISSVAAGSITGSSAVISWTTNEASDTQIEYGTTTSYGSSTTRNSVLTTSHSGSLSGLLANTTYHYRVLSRDGFGNLAVSVDFTFKTAAASDTTAPTATLTATNIAAPISGNHTFSVSYTDNAAIDPSTLDGSDVLVQGPNSYSQTAHFISFSGSGNHYVAIYSVTPPAGATGWTANANGIYTVSMRSGQVTDTSHNAVAAGAIGTFSVSIVPTDLAGNSLATARSFGTMTAGRVRTADDYVGTVDRNDYYRFVLGAPLRMYTRVYSMSDDADLWLLDRNGVRLNYSKHAGAADERLVLDLKAGTYYLRVPFVGTQGTTYRLRLETFNPPPSPAQNLGTLSPGVVRWVDGSVSTTNRSDAYVFRVDRSLQAYITLRNMTDDADLVILDSIGRQVAISQRTGSTGESITLNLAPGTYYVNVLFTKGVSATNYRLRLQGT
jgi:hypothetical protein